MNRKGSSQPGIASKLTLCLLIALLVTSCNKALNEENEKLTNKLADLEGGVNSMRSELKESPEQLKTRMEEATQELAKAKENSLSLAKREKQLQQQHEELKKSFEKYQKAISQDEENASKQ